MARETGSGRLHKFWWVLAFTLGTAVGAFAFNLLHAQNTFWIILFLGTVTGAVAIFEQFGDARGRGSRVPLKPARRGVINLPSHSAPPRAQANGKHHARRAQLHAITGKKNADPPSSGSS